MAFLRSLTGRGRKPNGDSAAQRRAMRQLQPVESGRQIEEETAFDYHRREFYPVWIGMIIKERYEVLAKLDWGSAATTWFCKDQVTQRFVALKITAIQLAADGSRHVQQRLEWKAYNRLSGMETSHEGVRYIREIQARFDLSSPSAAGAEHACLVFDVAGVHLTELERIYPGRRLPINLTKDVLKNVLKAMDFLHSEAGIVHTDIRKENIFFPASQRCCALFAERVAKQKPAGKLDPDTGRIIYRSTHFPDLLTSQEMSLGRPVLGDFSEAQIIKDGRHNLPPRLVGPEPFRSPESIIGMPLNTGLDLWALSQLAFAMVSSRDLLTVYDHSGDWNSTMHLAQMHALMSSPPRVALIQSRYALNYWEESGSWKRTLACSPRDFDAELDAALEAADRAAHGHFIDFLRGIFKWMPEERSAAGKLLQHRFLDENRTAVVHPYEHEEEESEEESFAAAEAKRNAEINAGSGYGDGSARRPGMGGRKQSMDVACRELKQMKRKQSVLRRAFMG
ncbi:hypothetical protein LTR62_004941 [Meristemomyces frigidus]|uniref:EKC/KEOPS complex subunit BUD32 n=1 Tax=Meristemomyces frigidus TaxID=1508187 RepID=A0AAN7YNU6_9PEZI|nr:hypothetical protein LTR62_004941 [Meristemomyces frigidus]